DTGEIQLNKETVSGIPTFQISRFASKALDAGRKVYVKIDFYPSTKKKSLINELENKKITLGAYSLMDVLCGFLNDKLSGVLIKEAKLDGNKLFKSVNDEEFERLISIIKEYRLDIIGTAGFDSAQVCAGGIDLSQIDLNSMMSRLHKGIYFCGEILDVDGICGGYNLQWAWASGYIAGINACKG
nr:NAD(P)/FAD-dependent oxidoreductase [Lachnospiraceae bacterium]